jgi:hypothetical protein
MRDDATNVSHAQTLVKRYNNAARVMLKVGDVNGARGSAARARALVERLLAADPRNVANATMFAGVLSMSSDIEYRDGKYARAIELARASLAADARLPADTRAGLIVRDNAAGAMVSLAASNCALAGKDSQSLSAHGELLREARSLLVASRAFKQELVDRKIDAREAARAIDEIGAELRKCDALLARVAEGETVSRLVAK